MITVRCKQCNTTIKSDHHTHSCGCPNMMTVIEDKVTAVDLSKVVMIESTRKKKSSDVLSNADLSYQEERRKRKVKRLDFDVR
jgi:protein-arginine kinase activator protein McsA